jgi:hypothetical protein
MRGSFSDGPVRIGDQLTGGGTVGGEEEHGDVKAGRAGQQGRPSPHGLSGQLIDDGEKKRQGILGDTNAVASGVRYLRAGKSTGPGDHLRLDGPRHVVCTFGSPNGVVSSETGQKSLGEVNGEKDFGGARAGPRQECANHGPSDVIRSWPRDGHARQVGDLDGDGFPVAGADVDAPGMLAALSVVEWEDREGRHFVELVVVSVIGGGLEEVLQSRPQRLGGEVATGPGRAVAVGVTAPEPTQGNRREHGSGE